jgi:hypothetical protein
VEVADEEDGQHNSSDTPGEEDAELITLSAQAFSDWK